MNKPPLRTRPARYDIRLSAELKLEKQIVTGTTRNLSLGGVCVEIDRPVAEGKLLRMMLFMVEDDIEAEGARGLELTGTVQWAAEGDEGFAIGIKFGQLTTAQSTALAHALKALGGVG